jgi:hypothetical protein
VILIFNLTRIGSGGKFPGENLKNGLKKSIVPTRMASTMEKRRVVMKPNLSANVP